MQVTVFGANGKVGQLVVDELLHRGHKVVAATRRASKFTTTPGVESRPADIYDRAAVTAALAGSQLVISCLSSWHTPRKDVLASGMRTIIPAMQAAGIERIVSLTGSDALVQGDHVPASHRLVHALLGVSAGKILADGEAHVQLLAESDRDWTVIRSPIMTETGHESYTLRDKLPPMWATVNRHAVARAMVDVAEQGSHVGAAPVIYRR